LSHKLCDGYAMAGESPSPPFRGEREGPVAERWEGVRWAAP
jgi:hypothetical protein